MNRLVLAICVSAALLAPTTCRAEEPYREWLKFFDGQWDVDWGGQWSVSFHFSKGKSVVYGEVTEPSGNEAFVIWAWDAGKKALVFNWFGSNAQARQEYTVFNNDVMSGLMYGSGPDGATTGNAIVQRFGPDKYKVTLKIADAQGKVSETTGELTRKK